MLAGVALAFGVWFSSKINNNKPNQGYPNMGGDFTLHSADGPVTMDDLKGQVVALYFGYTFCPDICPTSLMAMGQAFKALPEDQLKEVTGVFVTVDPDRDTPQIASEYAKHFHPRIKGLSGTPEEIKKVAKQYFVIYEKVELENSEMGYTMDHSSFMYILGKDGVVKSLVHHSSKPDEILAALKQVLSES